jgi:chromosome segregation ATPase
MNKTALAIIAALSASIALADDFKTIDGKEYKNATVSRVEPDGIVLITKSGISKVYFTELPKEVQERFYYDPKKAAAYLRQKAKATRKNNEQLAKERADIHEWFGDQRQNVQTLQARYQQLQQQEADLLSQIGAMQSQPASVQIPSGRHSYSYTNPLRANLPSLQSQLSEIRREKAQVREQLEKTQH